jgi:membrane-bound serine protease (ClpP class)
MHAWLAFLAGVLVVVGAFLILSADLGIAYYGLGVEVQAVIAIILLVFGGIVAWLFYVGVKAQHRRIKTGREALIGAHGVATTDIQPKGEVRVLGEFWQAKTRDVSISNGQDVVVIDMEGMFLVVKSAEQKA